MNQNYYQDEVEIDLIQFCKRLLVQWRAVVAVALIFGILVMYGKYMMDVKNYKAAKATEETYNVETAIENMDEADYDAVVTAIRYKQQLDVWNEYLENSLYIGLNPMACEQVRLLYKVDVEGTTSAANVIAAYRESLLSDEVLSEVATSVGLDCDLKYLREIVGVESQKSSVSMQATSDNQTENVVVYDDNSSAEILLVSVMVPDGVDASVLKNALGDAVDSCDKMVESYNYSYRMSFMSDTVTTISDIDMLLRQNSMMEQYDKIKTSQKSKENALSGDQKQLYQAMLSEEKNKTESMATEKNVEKADAPSKSKKYFALGFVLGIIIYAGLYFLWILLNPYAVELAVADVTKLPFIGRIQINNKKTSLFAFFVHDAIVYRWLNKDTENFEKAENIIGQMQVYAGNKDEKRFQILQPGFDVSGESKMEDLGKLARNQNIEVNMVSLDLSDIKASLSKIDTSASMVLAVYETKTLKKDITILNEMLSSQNARVIGELHIS